ncbi:MAG TPA: serine protease [Gammaproteobacteria bacterium]|nr:serine protease [Gammaproteobacteria bacterium]
MELPDDNSRAILPPAESDPDPTTVPVIEFLSGRNRGTHEEIAESTVFLAINEVGGLWIIPASKAVAGEDYPIRLQRSGDTYELEVIAPFQVWVNGEQVSRHTLVSGELLEIGRNGPMARYRIYAIGQIPLRTASHAFYDCIDCARYADGSLVSRSGRLVTALASELVMRTTLWFRILVVVLIVALIVSTTYLSRQSRNLEARLEQEASLKLGIAELLRRSENEAITREQLSSLRKQLEKRVDALEARSVATRKVIAEASKSIVFIQASYQYFDLASERPLRYALDEDGELIGTPFGPVITLEGDGPLVELQYTGTAFVVGAPNLLVTNRHVAMPWESNPAHERFEAMGLVAKFDRFIGYMPGVDKYFDVQLIAASDEIDIAALSIDAAMLAARPLPTGLTPVQPGDEVLLIGYPAGVQAMLARTDTKFLDEIGESGALDFWTVVEKLSASGLLSPLATRGIVGQVTPNAVVYDAGTTYGGSGGPVLNMQGEVIAVNTAIMEGFSGANLGLPIVRIMPFLQQSLELIKSREGK